MEVKQGSQNVPILVRPRQGDAIITLAVWQAQYGWTTGQTLQYTLEGETADKVSSVSINYDPSKSTVDGIYFELPASMFTDANKLWTLILKGTFNTTIDFSLYNFGVKVVKGDSPNSR